MPVRNIGHSPDIGSQKTSKAQNISSQLPFSLLSGLTIVFTLDRIFPIFSWTMFLLFSLIFMMHNRENKTTRALLMLLTLHFNKGVFSSGHWDKFWSYLISLAKTLTMLIKSDSSTNYLTGKPIVGC